MSLFEKWQELVQEERSEEDQTQFWEEYFPKEQAVYEYILGNKLDTIEGTITELSKKFEMDTVTVAGFLDGINTSLVTEIDLDSLTEDSNVTLAIDFEKLYYNMLVAQADWLYNIPAWDSILSVEKRKEIKKAYNNSKIVRNENKVGRNDPCPCGSGKKYKKCCLS